MQKENCVDSSIFGSPLLHEFFRGYSESTIKVAKYNVCIWKYNARSDIHQINCKRHTQPIRKSQT